MDKGKLAKHRVLARADKKILAELQRNGRISYAELARRVGLTTSPCMERVKRLEQEGYIKGYTAILDAEKLGNGLVVFVQIRLVRMSQDIFAEFARCAAELTEVQECCLVSGSFDYLIKARVSDMSEYRRFLGETLLSLPHVQESTSFVVMEEVKDSYALRLGV